VNDFGSTFVDRKKRAKERSSDGGDPGGNSSYATSENATIPTGSDELETMRNVLAIRR
jgi:hypothetical protein